MVEQNKSMKAKLFTAPKLNFQHQIKVLKNALKRTGKAIMFRQSVLTQEALSNDILPMAPRILHLTCHSNANAPRRNGKAPEAELMFENHNSCNDKAVTLSDL